MTVTLQDTGFELTEEQRDFIYDRLRDCLVALGDLDYEPIDFVVQIERSTQHHRHADRLYRATANVNVPGRLVRVEEEGPDVRAAVARMKDGLMAVLVHRREERRDEQREGARRIKQRLHGGSAAPR